MMIPSDWKMDKFGDLAKITCGVAATPEYVDAAVGVPFLSARNVQKERLDLSYFQHIPRELHTKLTKNTKPAKGDILLTRVGAGIGEAAVVDIDFEFSVYVSLTLIKCGKEVSSDYIKSLLNTNYYRYLATRDQFAGGGVQNLNVQMVKEYPIPVPPLPEQEKIAQILSTWDKAITTTEQLLANSQQQKKAMMQQLLTGKQRLLDQNGERFEGEWREVELGSVLKEVKRPADWDDDADYKLLSVKRRSEGVVLREVLKGSEILTKKMNAAHSGDFLISKMQIVHGAAGLVPDEFNGFHISNSYISLIPKDERKLSIHFFAWFAKQKLMYHKAFLCSYGVHIEKMTFNFKLFLKEKVRVPASIEEQQKIAAVLYTADQEITTLQQQVDHLKQEKKALMQQLLTGKRRVTVDA